MGFLSGIGSGFGLLSSNNDESYYNGLSAPTAKQLQYQAQNMRAAQAKAALIGPNAMNSVTGDQGAQAAQSQALQQMQNEAQSGGLSAADKAAENQALGRAASANAAQQGAIAQRAAATGQAGGGAGLAQALAANMQNAQSNADAASNTAQAAQTRKLGAAQTAADIGANLNQQTTARQSNIAQAQNAINAANANAANQVGLANAQSLNQAGLANMNANNQAAYQNAQANNQSFQDQLGLANARSGANQADRSAQGQGFGDIGSAGDSALKAAGSSLFAEGGAVHDFRAGGPVPGHAKVAGDSLRNDTVPAMLSPGEVVVKRSAVAGGPRTMMQFLEQVTGEDFPVEVKPKSKPKKKESRHASEQK